MEKRCKIVIARKNCNFRILRAEEEVSSVECVFVEVRQDLWGFCASWPRIVQQLLSHRGEREHEKSGAVIYAFLPRLAVRVVNGECGIRERASDIFGHFPFVRIIREVVVYVHHQIVTFLEVRDVAIIADIFRSDIIKLLAH